uniref:Uncharacterized protein n=1 Tax=Echinococcus canadensis TaxID=519352 RepID=A0A915EZ47_9CEST
MHSTSAPGFVARLIVIGDVYSTQMSTQACVCAYDLSVPPPESGLAMHQMRGGQAVGKAGGGDGRSMRIQPNCVWVGLATNTRGCAHAYPQVDSNLFPASHTSVYPPAAYPQFYSLHPRCLNTVLLWRAVPRWAA